MIPAELKFLTVYITVFIFIKHWKHLLQFLLWHNVNVSFVISEQRPTDERELGQGQQVVTMGKYIKRIL